MNPLHIQSRYFSNCCFGAVFPLKENLSYLQLLGALGREPHFFSRSGVWGASVSAAGPRGCVAGSGVHVSPSPGRPSELGCDPSRPWWGRRGRVSGRPWGCLSCPVRCGLPARAVSSGLCVAGDWLSVQEEASSRSPCTTSLNHPSKLKFHISYVRLFRLCKTERKINISFKAYWIINMSYRNTTLTLKHFLFLNQSNDV